jgi:hypothetical protein
MVLARLLMLAAATACSEGSTGLGDGALDGAIDVSGGDVSTGDVSTGDRAPDQPDAILLPTSLKGYELYAWDEGELLWFTLITGTNREKTLTEITEKNVDERGDFVRINSSGWEELERILALVPRGTQVALISRLTGLPPLREQSRSRIVQMLSALGN